MTFIQQFETELARKIESAESTAAMVAWACEKVLESFRNGIVAGRRGETVKRQGQSRRRGICGKAE